MKNFFDGIFIDENKLLEQGIKYPIKVEYYKITTETDNVENKKYGIEVVKTEYKNGNLNTESKIIPNITNNINETDRILTILRDNEVTPIATQDVLEEIAIGRS